MRKLVFIVLLTITLVACGDDSGTSANDGKGTELAEVSSSSKAVSSSSKRSGGDPYCSSSAKNVSSSSQKGDAGTRSSSSGQALFGMTSSSKTVSSSSSAIPASSGNHPSSSSKKAESSSSEKNSVLSSSRDYTPYAHDTCLAGNWNVHKDAYKTFIDPRNGRSYYYYTAVSSKTGKSVTVMAENLNIGDMVLGENDQNDDSKIERYCYNNDTTYCDEFGGLYQWAEMMQLPSRCNTESCADLIQLNHQGICPDGWRLFTWDDYLIIRQYEDKYDEGISGLRSQCFNGTNTSGFSLVGAGERTRDGTFESLSNYALCFYPQEYAGSESQLVYAALVSKSINESPGKEEAGLKKDGYSVRCVKLE